MTNENKQKQDNKTTQVPKDELQTSGYTYGQPSASPPETDSPESSMHKEGFFTTKRIVRAATIAAMYVILTFVSNLYSGAYDLIQFRISEALTILPLFFPEAIAGLTIGCLISNIFSTGNIALDMTLGTSATLVAATLTYIIGRLIKKDIKIMPAIIPPIVINALAVPFMFLLTMSDIKEFYWINVLFVGAGQAGVLIALGIPLYFLMKRLTKTSKWFQG